MRNLTLRTAPVWTLRNPLSSIHNSPTHCTHCYCVAGKQKYRPNDGTCAQSNYVFLFRVQKTCVPFVRTYIYIRIFIYLYIYFFFNFTFGLYTYTRVFVLVPGKNRLVNLRIYQRYCFFQLDCFRVFFPFAAFLSRPTASLDYGIDNNTASGWTVTIFFLR